MPIRTLLLAFLLLPLPAGAVAQEASDSARAELLAERGMSVFQQGTAEALEQAIGIWAEAARLYERAGQRAKAGETLTNVGYVHSLLSRLDSALLYYAQALVLSRQAGDRPQEGVTLNNIGAVHIKLGQLDSALVYQGQALEIMRAVGDRRAEGVTLTNIGYINFVLGRADSALGYYAEALDIGREIEDAQQQAVLLNNIAQVQEGLGQPDSALVRYTEALGAIRELGDRSSEGVLLGNIAINHSNAGRPDSALAYFRQALGIAQEVGDRIQQAKALNNVGQVHQELGRPDSAFVYFAQALEIFQDAGDRRGAGFTLGNIGMVHLGLGVPDSALAYSRRALEIVREVEDRSQEGVLLNNIGRIHDDIGQADSALIHYTRALGLLRETGNRKGEGGALINTGKAHFELGRPDSALAYLTVALANAREIGDRRAEGTALNNIGVVRYEQGHPDSTLVYYDQAVQVAREIGDRSSEGATLGNLGYVYAGRDESTQRDLARAVAYYDSAAAAVASVAQHAGGDQNRLTLAEQDVGLFTLWALAWLARPPGVTETGAALAALAASERGRSQALLDLMRRSAGEAGLHVPPPGGDLAAEGERLVRSATAEGAAVLSYLVTADTLIAWLAAAGGGVHVYRTPVSDVDLGAGVHAFRSALAVDSAAVRARMLTREAPALEEQSGGERGFGIGTGDGGDWVELGRQLSDLLLPPDLLRDLPASGELVVVPHGPTNLVPFAALVLPTGEPLGARLSVRYAPSLAALAEARERSPRAATRDALVVGDPAMPLVTRYTAEPVQLSPLPGAAEEGAWVAAQLGTNVLGGDEATETFVRERLPDAGVVHLATHGYAYSSEERARDSFVALAPDGMHDGLLTVGEVLDGVPSLSAELVVLSACQTGLGDLRQAEGTVGLQRAFLAKGARSVLVSLWSVSDDATERLMRAFYSHWLEDADGPSKAEALRRAQEDVRSDPDHPEWEHPRYWAAFQLVGAR